MKFAHHHTQFIVILRLFNLYDTSNLNLLNNDSVKTRLNMWSHIKEV